MDDSDGDEVPLNQVQTHLFQGAESGYDSENTAHDDGHMASNHSEGYEDEDSLTGAADDSRPGNDDVYEDDEDDDLDEDEEAVQDEVDEEVEEEEVDEDEDEEDEADEADEAEEAEVGAREDEDFVLEKEEMAADQVVSQQSGQGLQNGGNQGNLYEDDDDDDDDDDDEDDIPLAARMNTVQPRSPKVQNLRFFKNREDDDVPLAKLYKRHKPKRRRRTKATPAGARGGRVSKTTTKSKVSKTTTTTRSRRETKREPKPRTKARQPKKEKECPKFEKIGQRRETPPDNDPQRLFYQSMYKEKLTKGKHCFVAENWCLRYGLLEEDTAREVMSRWDLGR